MPHREVKELIDRGEAQLRRALERQPALTMQRKRHKTRNFSRRVGHGYAGSGDEFRGDLDCHPIHAYTVTQWKAVVRRLGGREILRRLNGAMSERLHGRFER